MVYTHEIVASYEILCGHEHLDSTERHTTKTELITYGFLQYLNSLIWRTYVMALGLLLVVADRRSVSKNSLVIKAKVDKKTDVVRNIRGMKVIATSNSSIS